MAAHLSPTTLTTDEQRLILRATAGNALPGRRDGERGLCLRRKRAGEKDLSTALLSELDDVQ